MNYILPLTFLPFLICLGINEMSGQVTPTQKQVIEVEGLMIQAKKEFLIGKADQAISSLKTAIKKDPSNATAHFELARIYFIQKNNQEALEEAVKSQDLDAKNKWLLLLMIDIYKSLEQFDQIVNISEQLQKVDGVKPDYVLEEIDAWMKLSKPENAIKTIRKYESQTGVFNTQIVRRKISIYKKMGKSKKELGAIQNAIKTEPTNVQWLLSLANHYKRQNKGDKALTTYQRVLKLDPNNPQANYALTQKKRNSSDIPDLSPVIGNPNIDVREKVKLLYPYLQKYMQHPGDQQQIMHLSTLGIQLTKLHPEEAISWAFLADIYQQQDLPQKALDAYRLSLAKGKSTYSVWEQTLRLMTELRDYDLLLSYSDTALNYFPNRAWIYFMNARAAFRLKKYEHAQKMGMESLMMAGSNEEQKADSYHLLGMITFEQSLDPVNYPNGTNEQLLDKAILQLEKALAFDNTVPVLVDDYAFILAHKTQSMSLEQALLKHAKYNEDNHYYMLLQAHGARAPNYDFTRGLIALYQKQYSEAIRWIDQGLNPRKPYFKEALLIAKQAAEALQDDQKISTYNLLLDTLD